MKKVLMLLANGVEPMEMAAFTDILGWADLLGDEKIELVMAGLRPEIVSTFDITIRPNRMLADVDLNEFDALALPGGFEPSGFYEEALSEPYLAAIKHFINAQKIVASVCVSSLSLGRAGALQDRKATIYHQVGGRRKQQLVDTGAVFIDQPIVRDKNIVTSSGPGTASEVAFLLIEMLTKKSNADTIRRIMRFPTPDRKWYETAQV
ncbi:DJ-1 family protein [Pseudomonas fluorescens]|uniref:DJ-1/PfpI family protein n=1 Tax=Pseudomonas fluorescens TaxID=294 RepID=UPI000CA13034|nr:DJ-1/PfpI family protein [Pseudomonas fluorescens]AUM72756.1 DJ-1 family protein [Pseudomonas fluorescens]MDP9780454.1 4-methyl-5(b-hydroxyethyl)-thiazole monophosphate biosynthesis [Pseudomonas fluorescens]